MSASKPSSPLLPLDPRITSGTLANGLSYYLQQHRVQDRRAQLVLVVKAGSVHEEDDQRGLAHFVEHLAFSGTQRFPRRSLASFFERSGMKLGSHANAVTSYDRTQYQLSVPTDDPALLLTALDVLADWAGAVSFDPEEVNSERRVLLSEWTSTRGAARRIGEQQRQLLFAGSRFAQREVLGEHAVLQSASRERLLQFYQRWYRPERMAVIVVGDIDPSALQPAIQQRFSPLARAASAATDPDTSFSIPVKAGAGAAVLTDPELPVTNVDVVLKAAASPVLRQRDYRKQLVSALASLMLNRRLQELAQNPLAAFTGAACSLAPNVLGRLDLLQLSAVAKAGQAQQSLEVLLREIERVRQHGFVGSELRRTKEEYARFLDQAVAGQATVEVSAISGALANHFVTGNAVTAAEFQRKLGLQLLRAIPLTEVNVAVLDWLRRSEQLLLISGATSEALPERAHVLAAHAAAQQLRLEAYRDRIAPALLLPEPPPPGSILAEDHIPEVDVTVWRLSNGARVVLKPTDFNPDQILEQSISPGGNARVPAADYASARVAHEIVAASGLGTLDRQLLAKVLTGKVVSAYPWIDEQEEGIRASAAPKDAETMLQLIHLFATAPRRDESAFDAYRAALRERLRNRDLVPQQALSDAVALKLWGDQPRRLSPTLASLDEMNLDRALEFYRERFGDVSDFTFVFVGKLDLASFRALVERYLASLPGAGRKEGVYDLGLRRRKGMATVRVQHGREDKASVTLIYHGESRWSESAHTDLVSLEGYLDLRLREVLREQLGGAYAPSVSSTFERIPYDAYTFAIAFECKSADVERLLKATRSVIADTKKSGVAAPYLDALTSRRTRDLEEVYRSNDFWLERLVETYRLGDDPRSILSLRDLTQRITSENLKLAARRYLRDDQSVDAVLTPSAPVAPDATSAPPVGAKPVPAR